jgi:uncharacterized protein YbgA (DUF1722 family)/uncharacterized protein YbbK (DUF523 family)
MTENMANEIQIKVGISACLLGQKVRFDAGHKKDRYLTDILGDYFEFVAVCPELEVGMGVPRESVNLVGTVDALRMVGNETGEDWTDRISKYSHRRARELAPERLSGYILKKNSPSCGMEHVKLYSEKGMAERKAQGMYAKTLMAQYPLLPVEEEGRLHDARLRENFIVRVFAYHRLQNLFNGRYSRGALVKFHTAHKYLLMAHSPKHYRELGQLVARVKQYTPSQMRDKYCALFMECLKVKTTTRKNVNVLHHILGFLKENLSSEDKQDIIRVIEDYRNELAPLIVPITLVRHYVMKHDVEYIKDQIYLNPHPKELMLRNHV